MSQGQDSQNSVVAQKNALRAKILNQRLELNQEALTSASAAIRARVVAYLDRSASAPKAVCFYAPIKNEAGILPLFNMFKNRSATCFFPKFPKTEGLLFDFYPVSDLSQLVPGRFGILEASSNDKHKILCFFDPIVLVPGLAFSKLGQRLGYGKGHYDRSISALRECGVRPHLVGIAYDFQVMGALAQEATDIPVDAVITECGTYLRK